MPTATEPSGADPTVGEPGGPDPIGVENRAEPSPPLAEHTIVSGEHLWSIAAARVEAEMTDTAVDNTAIAHYWRRLIDENLGVLRSGNADLVYPGEVIRLPLVESNR